MVGMMVMFYMHDHNFSWTSSFASALTAYIYAAVEERVFEKRGLESPEPEEFSRQWTNWRCNPPPMRNGRIRTKLPYSSVQYGSSNQRTIFSFRGEWRKKYSLSSIREETSCFSFQLLTS